MRPARNIISRTRELALRAAELMDDGMTDGAIAERMNLEFNCRVSARTVGSFRKRDYEPIAAERLQRIEDAREVQLILDAARGSGATFAEATSDLLAKQLVKVAKSVGKLRDLEIQELKLKMQQEKEAAARAASEAAEKPELSKLERKNAIRAALKLPPLSE